MKTDISRVKQLLQIKKVDYEEVCLAVTAVHETSGSQFYSHVQIDLAVEPRRRSEMLVASDGVSSLPQCIGTCVTLSIRWGTDPKAGPPDCRRSSTMESAASLYNALVEASKVKKLVEGQCTMRFPSKQLCPC